LLNRPRVLFLDEPSSSLDPWSAGELRELVVGLPADEVAIVLSRTTPARPRPGSRSGLGFHERRRTYANRRRAGRAIAPALGAFVWGESAFVTGGGLLLGAAIAVVITALLVKVLTGVFDPRPTTPPCPGPTWPACSSSRSSVWEAAA